jgi:hypothetical protein
MKSLALQGYEDANQSSWRSLSAPNHEPEQADFCSREGAVALKAKIEAYWRERGLDVLLSLHNVGFHPAIRAARYDVRSDMINGMPRAALKTAQNEQKSVSVSLVATGANDNDGDDIGYID